MRLNRQGQFSESREGYETFSLAYTSASPSSYSPLRMSRPFLSQAIETPRDAQPRRRKAGNRVSGFRTSREGVAVSQAPGAGVFEGFAHLHSLRIARERRRWAVYCAGRVAKLREFPRALEARILYIGRGLQNWRGSDCVPHLLPGRLWDMPSAEIRA